MGVVVSVCVYLVLGRRARGRGGLGGVVIGSLFGELRIDHNGMVAICLEGTTCFRLVAVLDAVIGEKAASVEGLECCS